MKLSALTGNGCKIMSTNSGGGSTLQWEQDEVCCGWQGLCFKVSEM